MVVAVLQVLLGLELRAELHDSPLELNDLLGGLFHLIALLSDGLILELSLVNEVFGP